MTKQHFIALADTLRDLAPTGERMTDAAIEQYDMTVRALADFCATQNPVFNRERWLAYVAGECGPNGGAVKK